MVDLERPVFVVGAQRSGTTWVQRLLAAHPEIVGGQESHLFSGYFAPMVQRWRLEHDYARDGGRTTGLGCYLTETEFLAELRRLSRFVFGRIGRLKPAARVLVEKTPDHGLHLPLIRRLFPEAAVIHVVRDGRDVVASLLDAGRRKWGRSWASSDVREAAARWATWVRQIRRDLPACHRRMEIRYEDLQRHGPHELAGLFNFLGVADGADVTAAAWDVNRFEAGSSVGRVESLIVAGDFQLADRDEPEGFFRRGQVGSWRHDLTAEELAVVAETAGDLLRELGYADDRRAAAA